MPPVTRRTALSILSTALTGTLFRAKAEIPTQHKAESVADRNAIGKNSSQVWYRRALRWGQTNITSKDPIDYNVAWWREQWKRTAIQGVIINAGGIEAHYPSKVPLHLPAEFLNGRDLYGELAQAAHEDGLAVLARMDSGCTAEHLYRAHPDWFTRNQAGEPYKPWSRDTKYIPCINGPYYDEYIPEILREIIERTKPEGFFDNFGSNLTRGQICYCENCVRRFQDKMGEALPRQADWNDRAYRKWIQWNYDRRTELWESNNGVTRKAAGPHCLWIMNNHTGIGQSYVFRDLREIAKRSEFLMLDNQWRHDSQGFQANGDLGKLLHQLVGWDKVVVETVGLFQGNTSPVEQPPFGRNVVFHATAKPEPEARMWMTEAIASGMGPWWHMVGANQHDRRMYRIPERVFKWHEQHEVYLTQRSPVAVVGVIWSLRNADYFGRDNASELVHAPYRGFTEALIRARIPYLPLHASDIEQASDLAVLILPNVGSLSEAECDAIRRFARRGGAVIASGATSLYDDWGDARADFELADLFGVHLPARNLSRSSPKSVDSYLRLMPETSEGPHRPKLPDGQMAGQRHPVLRGFEMTDIIPFGGEIESLRVDPRVTVPLTFVPPIPAGEVLSWLPEPRTDIPGLVLNLVGDARVAYLQADLDRRYAHDRLPDHGNLLANIVRWAAGDRIGFELHGPGLIDCHVYRQPGRVIVHLVNLTNEGTWRGPIDELLPVGPLKLSMRLPDDVRGSAVECLVSGQELVMEMRQNWVNLEVRSVLDHEVLVIS